MGFGKGETDSENKMRRREITQSKLCTDNTKTKYRSYSNKNAYTKCKMKLMNYVGVSIELFNMLNIQKQQAPR